MVSRQSSALREQSDAFSASGRHKENIRAPDCTWGDAARDQGRSGAILETSSSGSGGARRRRVGSAGSVFSYRTSPSRAAPAAARAMERQQRALGLCSVCPRQTRLTTSHLLLPAGRGPAGAAAGACRLRGGRPRPPRAHQERRRRARRPQVGAAPWRPRPAFAPRGLAASRLSHALPRHNRVRPVRPLRSEDDFTDSRYAPQLCNQDGTELRLPEADRKALVLGLLLQSRGQRLLAQASTAAPPPLLI